MSYDYTDIDAEIEVYYHEDAEIIIIGNIYEKP